MTHLKNSPLIYVLGMVQFPRVPNIERFTESFFEKIRNEYPLDDKVDAPIFNANISPEGIKIHQNTAQLWQFSSVDRHWGFVLTDQSFCLHTSTYIDFIDFLNRFDKGISTLLEIPEINIKWVKNIGLRYVNMISIQNNENLNDYLNSWVLPVEPGKLDLTIVEGAYLTRYKTNYGELRLQSIRNPQFTLPPELNSPLIVKNGWIRERPKTEFALIDTDNSYKTEQPRNFEKETILNNLSSLREISKAIFNSIGTEKAVKSWGG